jgi:hypothetical protein
MASQKTRHKTRYCQKVLIRERVFWQREDTEWKGFWEEKF